MCVLDNRYGSEPLTEDELRHIEKFAEERKKELEKLNPVGLRPGYLPQGWKCPNCGSAHSPSVTTCPEPPRGGGSLRDMRLDEKVEEVDLRLTVDP